jgi:glutathione S-transferase
VTKKPRTLLAFAPMINCEATRCVLEYYGLPYHEVDRLFGWVNIQTFFHGGYGEVPIYYGGGLRLSGPAPIVRRFDANCGSPRLLPPEQPLRTQINSEWLFFHNVLSSGVAPFAYYHLLPQIEAMAKTFGDPLSPLGRALMPIIYPGFRWLLSTLLQLNPARIDDCRTRMLMILDRVDRRLSTHEYLVGDHITLADIGFISSSAPILVPEHYAKQLPSPEYWPPAFAETVREARSRPCWPYACRIYGEIARRAAPTLKRRSEARSWKHASTQN